MRPATLTVAVAVTLLACGGGSPNVRDDRDDDGDDSATPFARDEDFEPEAFGVKVTGEGRPIIFIPGLACPGEVWDDTVKRMGDGYEAHVLTLSGFAGRPPIAEPLSKAVRRDLVRYIRAKKLDHPIIVGHSMGGFIAYWIASYHPQLVGPVVIVDASPALSGDLEDAKQLRSRWRNASDAQFFGQVRAKFMSMTRRPERMRPIIELIARSDRRTIGDAIFEMMQTDLRKAVADIEAPVLILAADGGYRFRIKQQTEGIPDHEMRVIPHTGHFVMWDDPVAFHAALDAFLAAHPARE